jgi:hypothetical protein
MKTCSKCHVTQDMSEFYVETKVKCGVRAQCKTCTKVYRKVKQQDKNKALGLCTKCGVRKAAPDRVKCNDCRDQEAQYKRDNHERIAAIAHNRRARLSQMPGKLTEKHIKNRKKEDGYRCQRCGLFIEELSVDHVVPVMKVSDRVTPPGWRNDETNIQSLCKPCNSIKNHKNWWDYRDTTFDVLVLARAPGLPNGIRTISLQAAIRVKLDWRGPGHHWEVGVV